VGLTKRDEQRRARIDRIATGLPEVTSLRPKEHTTYLVGKKKIAWHLVDHHGNGRVELQTRAAPGQNAALVDAEPDRFFLPPYMAHHGWIGLWLDVPTIDWDEVEGMIVASYRLQAPKKLVKLLDEG
jgi:hypothetical protein